MSEQKKGLNIMNEWINKWIWASECLIERTSECMTGWITERVSESVN